MEKSESRQLAERLAEMLQSGLGQRSRWALNTALEAAQVDGITGVIVITVPTKQSDRVDVSFTVGAVDVVSRWGAA